MKEISEFKFKCSSCDEIHIGIPNLGTKAPLQYYSIPKMETKERVILTSGTCVIDDEYFYVRGCLELPVIGFTDFFSFGAWVSLSEEDFSKYNELFEVDLRDEVAPMFGWFSSWLWPLYEDDEDIKSRIHLRNRGIRPYIELEPTEHPLALAQKNGISDKVLIKIYEYYVHGKRN